jgi:hypothetical protein
MKDYLNIQQEFDRVLFSQKITLQEIDEKIPELEKILTKHQTDLEEYRKLPPDPSVGQEIDGFINENPQLKSMLCESATHVIGYCTGALVILKRLKHTLQMTESDYEVELKHNEEVEEHNRREMERVKQHINEKQKKRKN